MSLVGTRPPTLDEWEKYEPHHRARMSFRPGLTGLWQVSGRSNITDFEEVVKLDTQYIREWSVKGDIKIIWQTYHESPSGLLPPNLDPSLSIVYYVILMIMVSFLIGFHSPSQRSLRECGNEQSRDSAQSEDRSNK